MKREEVIHVSLDNKKKGENTKGNFISFFTAFFGAAKELGGEKKEGGNISEAILKIGENFVYFVHFHEISLMPGQSGKCLQDPRELAISLCLSSSLSLFSDPVFSTLSFP